MVRVYNGGLTSSARMFNYVCASEGTGLVLTRFEPILDDRVC